MARFRKRAVVQAVQTDREVAIETPQGTVLARPGDWIITEVDGERHPCRDQIFRKTYEPVDEPGEPWR